MSTDPDRRVVVTGEVSELRRRLGPTAWVVFEELLLASTGPTTGCSASVSVRSMAASSGLAKDTVARALIRLRAAGLVAVTQSRSTGGVFGASNYELKIPSGIILDDCATATPGTAQSTGDTTSTSTTRRNAHTRRRRADDGAQLTLLTP